VNPNPTKCPLCGKLNHCGMASAENTGQPCWCMSSDIAFPNSLLTQVDNAAKNKACICRECALEHQHEKAAVSSFTPV